MGKTIRILTNNYSGYAGSIIYYPYTGGTINLGSHLLPYDYNTDYYYGTYEIYISEFNKTCILNYSPPVCDFTGVEQVTPTPTITLTPTSTPTQTLTPTSTPTQTLTPTPTCYCTYIDVTITQIDLDSAVGNTINPIDNGSVYVKYRNCSGVQISKRYTIDGTYLNDICTNSSSSPGISYYAYNTQENGSSTAVKNGQCCIPITPTPTPTTTPTMTPAECSIILNDVTLISGTTWGYDFTNTVSSCEQLHLSYSLDNINWDAISTYDCVTVPALYDIGVVADIIYFRMTQECGDIPVTSNTIIVSTVTPTPTPTNTPTPTATPIPGPFISVWSIPEPITLVLPYEPSGTYSGTIDWGDGSTSANTYANRFHTYSTVGPFTITITGTIIGWRFNFSPYGYYIISVLQWGSLRLGNSGNYFAGCDFLDLSSVNDILDLTGTNDLTQMFLECSSITTINNINNWDVSNVTNMGYMFTSCYSFDDDIGNWDVSNVTNMESMLSSTSFNNGGSSSINNWNVSGVTTMEGMFSSSQFNQPISGWNVSNVQIMQTMFSAAFNQPIGNWDVSNVLFMGGMFNNGLFNQDIGNWNISGVTDFTNFMFGKTPATFSTTNLDAIYNGWSTKNPYTGLTINFGSANYTTSGGEVGKSILTGSTMSGGYEWIITDGGGI